MPSTPRQHSSSIEAEAKEILERHWQVDGYCVPNATTYPWQWLWDSCFHAIAWAELGDERAAVEISASLANQSADGFVPHMTYWSDPTAGQDFWGRRLTSCISQPPMFGHAIAELARRSMPVPPETVERASNAVRFWMSDRRHPSGLIRAVHPWETGCDDSPRWDHWCPPSYDFARWRKVKHNLVSTVTFNQAGSPVGNDAFDCASVGLTALVAFNARELAGLTEDNVLLADAAELVEALESRWDPATVTWRDAGDHEDTTGAASTLDGLLPMLVVRADQAKAALLQTVAPETFGGEFGPAATNKTEPVYDPHAYWRGPSWPQLSYLCWVAAKNLGFEGVAISLAMSLRRGAQTSGFAEYWHPDEGTPGGALPQSWATLAIAVR